ncbi:MAG: hypothetical protein IKH04_10910 [Kiritimatiellae bacterium]|nr:hypothetical protein [Kiritimatiellia bacterium]
MRGRATLARRLHTRLGELWWWTLLLFCAQRLGDLVNFATGAFIVPRFVPEHDLGAVMPLAQIAALAAFPLTILLLPVGKFLNVFAVRGEYGKVKSLLADSVAASALFSLLAGAALLACGDWILLRLHVADRRVFAAVAITVMVTCLEPLVQNSLKSLKCFRTIFATGLAAPFIRLGAMLLLLPPLGAPGYLFAQTASPAAGIAVGLFGLSLALRGGGPRVSWLPEWREMAAYAAPLVAVTLAGSVQGPAESFVIRQRLPEEVTAGYYFASVFGAIPGYFASAMMVILFPLVSDRYERGEPTRGLFVRSMAFTLASGLAALAAIAAISPLVFRLPGPWRAYAGYSPFVWQVGLVMLLKSLQGTFMTHESASRSFRYVRYMVPLYLLEAASAYILPAWSVARPFLPEWLWGLVDRCWTTSLQSFLCLIIGFNALFVVAMAIDWRCAERAKGRAFRRLKG